MFDPTSHPSTADHETQSPSPDHVDHVDHESRAGLRLQFCDGEHDITAHPTAEADADEVRLWDDEKCLAAVTHQRGRWVYAGGDCGHRLHDAHLHTRFADWRTALHTLTGLTVPPE